jgi:hypothetical protein
MVTIPKNPVTDTTVQKNGSYLKLGILVGALFNLGESSSDIIGAVRKALDSAKHDGVGQEA